MLDSLVVTLVADNKAHCRDTIQKTIFLENAFAANAFSPNGDGINDVFSVSTSGLSQATLQIYNRWGKKVFESQTIPLQWDGTAQGKSVPEGVYTFFFQGKGKSGEAYQRNGTITVIR
ncbi:MAG: gliding motility-associated C-terminal domain-containing protein, partial [Bacteroidia bacterium]